MGCADCGHRTGRPLARYCDGCRWKHRVKRIKYAWTPERDAILREHYRSHGRGSAKAVAERLGFPRWSVSRRAAELGLTRTLIEGRDWTPEEEAFLLEHAGTRHLAWIARKLDRTVASVSCRAKRHKIRTAIREGYTLRELELCFGESHRVIQRWVDSGKLRAARRHGGARPGFERDAYQITDAALVSFVTENPMLFRLDRVDQLWFMDLITGGGILRKALVAAEDAA